MTIQPNLSPVPPSPQDRIEALRQPLPPPIEPTVRQLVEHAIDVPQAEELDALDIQFRDDGQKLVNHVRQARQMVEPTQPERAGTASRKEGQPAA